MYAMRSGGVRTRFQQAVPAAQVKHYGDFWSCTTVFGIIRLNFMSLTHGNANSAHDDFELWGSKRARTRVCVWSADPKPKGRSIMAVLAHGTTVSGKFEVLTCKDRQDEDHNGPGLTIHGAMHRLHSQRVELATGKECLFYLVDWDELVCSGGGVGRMPEELLLKAATKPPGSELFSNNETSTLKPTLKPFEWRNVRTFVEFKISKKKMAKPPSSYPLSSHRPTPKPQYLTMDQQVEENDARQSEALPAAPASASANCQPPADSMCLFREAGLIVTFV
ncbi:hypothetical protein F5I97DRAFT_122309 [Phlebopus sp. FC_14]|nr:hypothetical protein F5I97DRAFT_122309 [Phlebopus sp. FC_14]